MSNMETTLRCLLRVPAYLTIFSPDHTYSRDPIKRAARLIIFEIFFLVISLNRACSLNYFDKIFHSERKSTFQIWIYFVRTNWFPTFSGINCCSAWSKLSVSLLTWGVDWTHFRARNRLFVKLSRDECT